MHCSKKYRDENENKKHTDSYRRVLYQFGPVDVVPVAYSAYATHML
jgi:hypothetical protein